MKSLLKYILVGMAALFIMGCSQTRQFVDPSWSQKPAKIKFLFTEPVFADTLGLPSAMKPISDWFKEKVDNTLKFNSNVPYDVAFVLKNEISHESEDMDGVNVKIPKIESMSDSFDVYLILDNIKMSLKNTYRQTNLFVGGAAPSSCQMTDVAPAPGCYTYNFKSGEQTFGSANYVVYDVKTGKRLAYGHLDEKLYHKEVAAEQGWYDTVRQLVLRVIEKTPIAQF